MSSFVIKTNGEQENRIVEEYQDVGREGKKTGERTEGAERGRGGRDGEGGCGERMQGTADQNTLGV